MAATVQKLSTFVSAGRSPASIDNWYSSCREGLLLFLKRLELINFRNYSRQVIEPDSFFNYITGPNAQGKTNILESIYLGCTGKSFRTSREKEIIKWGSGFSQVSCLFETENRRIEVKISLNPVKKQIEVNGAAARGYPLGWPGVVLFTPDDLVMVKGPPGERRRFLDLEVGPFHPQYRHYLGRYSRVLAQRNNLLREIRQRRAGSDSLEAWDEQFCRYGAKILFMRLELLRKLIPEIRSLHRQLTGGLEDIEIRYLSSVKIDGAGGEEDFYQRFKHDLRLLAEEEKVRAQSLIGPHRDDISMLINGSEAKIYGSQGQQRTIVLTLKLSQILHWQKELSEYPILLLDDVLFELDSSRGQSLIDRIRGKVQTFVTATGVDDLFNDEGRFGKSFTVREGRIVNNHE